MKLLSTIIPRGRIWRVPLMAALLAGANFFAGCTSWGQRQLSVERDSDSWEVITISGTNISDSFAGNLTIIESMDFFYFNLNGKGGAVDSSKGHEAKVKAVREVGKGVAKGLVSGATRGFVP